MLKLRFWLTMINYPSWSISFQCYQFKFEDLNRFLTERFNPIKDGEGGGQVFLVKSYKIEVMKISLTEMLTLPNLQLGLSKIQSKVNGQTINYCITISMQKNSSIHQFILEIRHKYFAHLLPCLAKTFRSNFYLPWICISIWRINLLLLFVLKIQQMW